MNRFYNKIFFKQQWKYCKWVTLGLSVEFLTIWVSNFSQSIAYVKNKPGITKASINYMIYNYNSVLVMIFSYILAAAFYIGIDRINNKYEIYLSMPFKREQIIFSKWICGIISCIVPVIITYFVIILMYLGNKNQMVEYISLSSIFLWGIISLLVYIFIMTFGMVIQFLSGSTIAAAVIEILIFLVPTLFVNCIADLLDKFDLYEKYSMNICIVLYANPTTDSTLSSWQKIVILLLVIGIFTFVLSAVFNNYKFEGTGTIIIYKPLEVIFKIWIAVSTGAMVPHIFISLILRNGIREFSSSIEFTMMVICGVVVYVFTDKIIRRSEV